MTRISVFAPDRPGLFYRMPPPCSGAGASIVDARIHTTRDGMALDNLLVTDARGKAYEDTRLRKRMANAVEKALRAEDEPPLARAGQPAQPRAGIPRRAAVLVSDKASSRTTVVEVNARDRPGLLARLAYVIHAAGHRLHSAHIATYGERAVDVFYLTAPTGRSCATRKAKSLRAALLAAAGRSLT